MQSRRRIASLKIHIKIIQCLLTKMYTGGRKEVNDEGKEEKES